ncbi:MAG: Fic family protein [Paucimonas sp.]|nr:Fic family protein [Paucimonas sp.]
MPHATPYVWQNPSWPTWRYDHASLMPAVTDARQTLGELLGAARTVGFASENLENALEEIWIQEAISTAAIEGQKLDLAEVRSSVMKRLGATTYGARSRSVEGLVAVMHDAISNHTPLDEDRLCAWQAALFPTGRSGIQKIEVGHWRSFKEPMQIVSAARIGKAATVHYEAPPSNRVAREMQRLLAWLNAQGSEDGIVKAAIAHLWFESIHPFEDGNGRVGRAVVDYVLAREFHIDVRLISLSAQLQANRKQYYDALNQAQKGELDATAWIMWFAVEIAAACRRSCVVVGAAVVKAKFWAEQAQKGCNERQVKVLRKLVAAGDGGFEGGLTREKYAKMVAVSDATATRDLAALVEKNALLVRGVGKGTKYYVNVAGWEHGG